MTKTREVYKCDICGNIVEMLHGGAGALVCCGEKMHLLEEHTVDEGKEKHVPVVVNTENGVNVKVGENPHPMEEKHYIEWIEIETANGVFRKELKPGMPPEASFCPNGKITKVREYCNIHGLWINKFVPSGFSY